MYLADCHLHSRMSHDGQDCYEDMADSAIAKGLSMICFTEHADDCCTGMSRQADSYIADRGKINGRFMLAKDIMGDKIRMCRGIELGNIAHAPAVAALIETYPETDMIIGSVHNFFGQADFSHLRFTSPDHCRDVAAQYMEELIRTVQYGCCDVYGHLGYIHRYMVSQGQGVDMLEFTDSFRLLFTKMIQAGIGIECNTSGLRWGAGSVFPLPELIRLYRELGGEIITIGSDAHCRNEVGDGVKEAQALLQDAGFRYFTVFEKRKPEFIPLG